MLNLCLRPYKSCYYSFACSRSFKHNPSGAIWGMAENCKNKNFVTITFFKCTTSWQFRGQRSKETNESDKQMYCVTFTIQTTHASRPFAHCYIHRPNWQTIDHFTHLCMSKITRTLQYYQNTAVLPEHCSITRSLQYYQNTAV